MTISIAADRWSGLRTATHAFKMKATDPFAKYSFDYKGADYELGFGHQVLGQTWVGHYGTQSPAEHADHDRRRQEESSDPARREGRLGAGWRLCRQADRWRDPHDGAAAQRHDARFARR